MARWRCPKEGCKFRTNTESIMKEHAEKIHGAKFPKHNDVSVKN